MKFILPVRTKLRGRVHTSIGTDVSLTPSWLMPHILRRLHYAEVSRMAVHSESQFDRRRVERIDLRCRARIVIGSRHYAGWIDDISCAGAKLQTLTPIRRLGSVLLRLPDLRPLQCILHWSNSHEAGVSFELPLSVEELSAWVAGRAEITPHLRRLAIADITELAA